MDNKVGYYNFTIGYHNVQGLHNKGGCKLPQLVPELLNDIEIWSETWACKCDMSVNGYDTLASVEPQKKAGIKKGRRSGGICVFIKKHLTKHVKVLKKSNNFIWLELNRRRIKNLSKNLIICATYIHDVTSVYFTPSIFEELNKDILNFCDQDTPLIITGDMNARTATLDENLIDPSTDHINCPIEIDNHTIPIRIRQNYDTVINAHGKNIIEMCSTYNLKILNGRSDGDPLGNLTYYDDSLGASAVDYSICSQGFYEYVNNFMVLPQNELSDHCKIVTELKGSLVDQPPYKDTYKWKNLENKIQWDENVKNKFIKYLFEAKDEINEINQRIEAGLVNSSGEMIQALYQNAAKSAGQLKVNPKIRSKNRETKPSKLWFDQKCNSLKKEVRKMGRHKHKDPTNIFLREIYCKKMKEFKRECKSKRFYFWKDKFEGMEQFLTNSKAFWENWKKCSENTSNKIQNNIGVEQWFKYFSNLHNEKGQNQLPSILNNINPTSDPLNEPFTKTEFYETLKNLKAGKASGFDQISNEMLKNSPDFVLSILEYINICLKKTLVSELIRANNAHIQRWIA